MDRHRRRITSNPFNKAHTPPSTSCNQCQLTDCASIHNYAVPDCPGHQICEACSELVELNRKIIAAHEQLASLISQRRDVNTRINRQHVQVTDRLHIEIISEIFFIVCKDPLGPLNSFEPSLHPAATLGLVCKKWRDITLGLPQLWSKIIIRRWDHNSRLSIVEEWLRRSSTSPLSLTYFGTSQFDAKNYRAFLCLAKVFRLHATQWKNFTFFGVCREFHDLLHNLDGPLQVDTLFIRFTGSQRNFEHWEPLSLKEPLCPRKLHIDDVPVNMLPLEWSTLTHLDAESLTMDHLLHVIRHARNLISCTVKCYPSQFDTQRVYYPLPTLPIIHPFITTFTLVEAVVDLGLKFLSYLTLPALKSLCYKNAIEDNLESYFDALVGFANRSGLAALDTFTFENQWVYMPLLWFERLPSITRLKYWFYGLQPTNSFKDLFRLLANTSDCPFLPHLQELHILASSYTMTTSDWSDLCDFLDLCNTRGKTFQKGIRQASSDPSPGKEQKCGGVRPLKMVYIEQSGHDDVISHIPVAILARILEIKVSDLRFKLVNKHDGGRDLIDSSVVQVRILDGELPFSTNRPWN